MLGDLKIRTKLLLIIFASFIGVSIVGALFLYNERETLLKDRKEKVKNLSEAARGVVEYYYKLAKSGAMTEQEAKTSAIENIRGMRYSETEYFWINDMRPNMILHPYRPELEGTDLTAIKDPKGKALFVEFANTVKESGGGFVYYMWPKPGMSDPQPKVSYVNGFKPWGWVVGTGVYMNDINDDFAKKAYILAAVIGLVVILLVAASLYIAKSIVGPIDTITENLKAIAGGQGNLTQKLPISSKDEVGVMAFWFNEFLEGMQQTIKQVVETASEVSEASMGIATATQNVKAATAEQVKVVRETTSAVERINESIKCITGEVIELTANTSAASASALSINENTAHVADISGQIDTLAEKTRSLVENMATGLMSAASNMEKLSLAAETTAATAEDICSSVLVVDTQLKEHIALSHEVRALALKLRAGNTSEIRQDFVNINQGILQGGQALLKAYSLIAALPEEEREISTSEIRAAGAALKKSKDLVENSMKLLGDSDAIFMSMVEKADAAVKIALELENSSVRHLLSVETNAKKIKSISQLIAEVTETTDKQSAGLEIVLSAVRKLPNLTSSLKTATINQSHETESVSTAIETIHAMTEVIVKETHNQESASVSITLALVASKSNVSQVAEVSRDMEAISGRLQEAVVSLESRVKEFTV